MQHGTYDYIHNPHPKYKSQKLKGTITIRENIVNVEYESPNVFQFTIYKKIIELLTW